MLQKYHFESLKSSKVLNSNVFLMMNRFSAQQILNELSYLYFVLISFFFQHEIVKLYRLLILFTK